MNRPGIIELFVTVAHTACVPVASIRWILPETGEFDYVLSKGQVKLALRVARYIQTNYVTFHGRRTLGIRRFMSVCAF